MNLRKSWKTFWQFIWDDDSWASWAANIILAFVLIKFLVYPGLGLMFGTSHPVVAVVSGSMEHDGNLGAWWLMDCGTRTQGDFYQSLGLTPEQFESYPFSNGFNKGDIMVIWGHGDIERGDVIVFQTRTRYEPIIHRVIETRRDDEQQLYKTKGDHNCGVATFEEVVTEDQIIGRATVRIPYLGWVKLGFQYLVSMILW